MSAKSAINKEIFIPHNERMLAAVQVKRRTKKKIPFLATGGQGDYMTFICLSGNLCLIPMLLIFYLESQNHEPPKPSIMLQNTHPVVWEEMFV